MTYHIQGMLREFVIPSRANTFRYPLHRAGIVSVPPLRIPLDRLYLLEATFLSEM